MPPLHGAQRPGQIILALYKRGIIKLGPPTGKGFKGLALKMGCGIVRGVDRGNSARPMLSNTGELTAGHHDPVCIDYAYHAIDAVLHLEHDSLKHPAGHVNPSQVILITLLTL